MVSRVGKKLAKKSSGGGFKYKARTVDDIKKRAEQSGGRFDSPYKSGFDVLRLETGESNIRILPATWEDHEHYGLDVWMHRYIGADNSNYLCLSKMLNKRCPACVEAKALKDAGEEDDMKKMQAQKRVLVWCIDRDDENDPPMPQIWDMSWSQDRDIAGMCHTKKTGKLLLLDHPDEGFDITVKKSGKGLKTKYQFLIDREPSRLADDSDDQDTILEYITENPLPDVLRYDTAEHIEKQLSGSAEEKDDMDDEDEPKKKKKRPVEADDEDETPRKRKRVVEEEDEDEVEEVPRKKKKKPVEEEDEDEEETPAPKKKKKAPVEEEDEDEDEPAPPKKKKKPVEEEEDEEDEEDEPAPPKKKKKKPVEEDEDEDEEEEAPPPKKKKTKKPVEEEEEEDEEEAPPPKKKKRRVVEEEEDED